MSDQKTPDKGRKWLLTINNPEQHGYTAERIISELENWRGVDYWCFGSEIGVNEKTPHYHFFIYADAGKKFKTIKNKYPEAHIDFCHGTCEHNKNYCWKIGTHQDTEKGILHDYSSNREGGTMPIERGSGYRTDLHNLYEMIKDGKTDYEILNENPDYIMQYEKIDKVRQMVKSEQFSDCWRELNVTYIYGDTGAGKTRYVMDKYGYRNVYRVTDYAHPFDSYKGQDVVIFEEFRSSLKLGDMLKYLDGYPVELPARYNNKTACFTKVYIISNISLKAQYPDVQDYEGESWKAFLRRIHEVWFVTKEGTKKQKTAEYMENEWVSIDYSPFEEE